MASESTRACADGFVAAARVDDILPGRACCVTANGRQVAIFRLRDGGLYALDNVCPHRGGSLSEGLVGTDYSTGAHVVICPLHSYKFLLRDGRGYGTGMATRSYPVKVSDGIVMVNLAE